MFGKKIDKPEGNNFINFLTKEWKNKRENNQKNLVDDLVSQERTNQLER
jgi:hypothetical protein